MACSGSNLTLEYQQLLQAISTCAAPIVHQLVRQAPSIVLQKGWHGQTPLHKACLGGNWTINYLLLEAGADPNVPNDNEETPLHYACKRGEVSVVHLLVQHKGDVTLVDRTGCGMMHHAALTCSVYVLHYLSSVHHLPFEQLNNKKQSPLHICSESGSLENAIKYLIRKNRSDVCQPDSSGNTPLHLSAKNGHGFISWLLLLAGGLRLLHATNNAGETPLSLVQKGSKLTHKFMEQEMNYLSQQPQSDYPKGPKWLWVWYLSMPGLLFSLTIIVAHVIGSPYQGFVFLAGLGLILSLLRSHVHRIHHICRWPNPVYAGTFAAGIAHTFIIYCFKVLHNVYHYQTLTIVSIGLAATTLYLYFTILYRKPALTKVSIFKDNSSERMTIVDLIGPPSKLGLFCPECEIVRLPSSKHCRLCECCLEEMDHHCLFLMKCIAKNNHVLFVWMLILLSFSMIIFCVNSVIYCWLQYESPIYSDVFVTLFKADAWLLSITLLNLCSSLWSFNLVRFQLKLVSVGLTTLLRPSKPESVLSTTERFINIFFFLQGKPIFARDPLYDV